MAAKKAKKGSDLRTRQGIIRLLKEQGPTDARALAEHFGTTAMAIRLHLYALQDEKLVTFTEEARPMGRPAKLWQLTAEADQFFPNGHADLVVNLIQAMGDAFGADGMDRLLATRSEQQATDYRKRIPARASLKERVAQLADIRTQEGYMAEVQAGEDGSLQLIENHCPICTAASNCLGLCAMELDVFKEVLGPDAEVERTEYIQAGARRCAYRICAQES